MRGVAFNDTLYYLCFFVRFLLVISHCPYPYIFKSAQPERNRCHIIVG